MVFLLVTQFVSHGFIKHHEQCVRSLCKSDGFPTKIQLHLSGARHRATGCEERILQHISHELSTVKRANNPEIPQPFLLLCPHSYPAAYTSRDRPTPVHDFYVHFSPRDEARQ